AIQAFSKADTILATLNSVVRCRGSENYDLLILQDGCFGSKRTEKYREARADTTRAIEAWAVANCQHFLSLSFQQADQNHGPYAIAERVINKAFETSKSVIFSEDDVIFEEDAIQWFERALSHPGFLHPAVWAVAGEAKFFDAKRHAPSSKEIRRALDVESSQIRTDRARGRKRSTARRVHPPVGSVSCAATISISCSGQDGGYTSPLARLADCIENLLIAPRFSILVSVCGTQDT